jgi:hypothetical protein
MKLTLAIVVLFCTLANGQLKAGRVDVSRENCSFNDAIFVYNNPNPTTQKSVGVLQDGAKVVITPAPRVKSFYLVQGDDGDGKRLEGYVGKGCVVVEEGTAAALPEIVPLGSSHNRRPVASPSPIDCTQFHEYLPGCKSFSDMLTAGDKDILKKLAPENEAYVCFRADEDVFTVVSVQRPEGHLFQKVATTRDTVEMFAFADFERYASGVSEDWKSFMGKWRKAPLSPIQEARFSTVGATAQGQGGVYIDDTEVTVSYQWKNLRNTMTSYSLKLRRSTHRLVETLEAPPAPQEKDRTTQQITKQGFCAEYNAQ